jgi:clan AA aspartic protease (TIGR02281 family)
MTIDTNPALTKDPEHMNRFLASAALALALCAPGVAHADGPTITNYLCISLGWTIQNGKRVECPTVWDLPGMAGRTVIVPKPVAKQESTLEPPVDARGEGAVPMVSDGGTFKVPVTINGQLTLKFVVDSGAADVSIPADVVGTLVRTETITDADFLGKQTYQMADGSTVPSMRFVIRSLKVGDKTLENVTGSIAPVARSLLLGQSFLSRFKSWSMDNQAGVLILK